MLDSWALPRVAAFAKIMWFDVDVYDAEELWDLMREAVDYLESDNSWEEYGGWLIAQGRVFHEAVMGSRAGRAHPYAATGGCLGR
jgi:hypothetical protein